MTWASLRSVAPILREHHYLGPIGRGIAWHDEFGVIVVASPTSRRIPVAWLELVRWCLLHRRKNDGSKQWARFAKALRKVRPDVTTIVSYSDPSQGHTGALYRACNWKWAPTWHRLRPPPSGNGNWSEKSESVKDRWIFPLSADPDRHLRLALNDESLLRRFPWAAYREPCGGDYRRFIAHVEGAAP